MQQFQIPQFIDIEDKVIGPLTIKQFLWLLLGGAVVFIIWVSLPLTIFLFLGIPAAIFFVALAFLKINGRPFIYFIMASIAYFLNPKILLFKKSQGETRELFEKEKPLKTKRTKRLSRDDIENLAIKLDQ